MVVWSNASASESRPVLEARALVKRYGARVVVDGVDLKVHEGECFGLLGPNGAGKTTTLRMVLGLTPPTAGELEVLGLPIPRQSRQLCRNAGVVPQHDNLDPDFTVSENLVTYGSYFGLSRQVLRERVESLLRSASLSDRAQAPLQALSGGMRRRLMLARALINSPSLIVLDEPTTGLDPQARQAIRQHFRALMAQGKTLILTTRYMEEAERLCSRLVIMDRGQVLVGYPQELMRTHVESEVVEVYGPGVEPWVQQHGHLASRAERVGETVFCYTRTPQPLLAALQSRPQLRYLHRPANLEDVFLRLTGRELRDA